MKALTVYEANDGSRWDSASEAIERDTLIDAVASAMTPLGVLPKDNGCSFANGGGYYQHTREDYCKARAALWELTKGRLGWWIDKQREMHGKTAEEVAACHPSRFCRMLDGSATPLERAWDRILCIDEQFREWGQQYYGTHPNEGEQVCLNQPAEARP